MFPLLLSGLAFAISLPALVLGCECLLALLPLRRDRRAERGERPTLAVIVPAHNEQAGIGATIDAILPQLVDGDRLIVVADNCDDRTADIARKLGATVCERHDDTNRGKGFAIHFALDQLAAYPPEVVICIDADCLPLPGCIERISRAAYASGHPIQAAYVMQPPEIASPGTRVSALAVLVKNYVRPRGLQRVRMPCLITGSGVAYPWAVLGKVPHPQSHIVEDMDYSIDLALAGVHPLPCMEAVVDSNLPDGQDAARTQRTRWEHGHLSVILAQAPRLLAGALRQRSLRLCVLLLELIVPPLSLLVLILAVAAVTLPVACRFAVTYAPLAIFTFSVSVASLGLAAAWYRYGRRVLPPKELFSIPQYILGKIAIYARFVRAPETTWIPTARESSEPGQANAPAPHFTAPGSPANKTTRAD
jgi:cellulose synthase/poly-beta-1,6-N-acetylglucosamine synthase-like glycosyltransferase